MGLKLRKINPTNLKTIDLSSFLQSQFNKYFQQNLLKKKSYLIYFTSFILLFSNNCSFKNKETLTTASTSTNNIANPDSGGGGDGGGVNNDTLAPMLALGSAHTCFLNSLGKVFCWGDNWAGQLGMNDTTTRGNSNGSMAALTQVYLGQGAKKIAAGPYHTCAILDDGTVKCWGYNSDGQLGVDNTTDQGGVANSMQNLPTVNLGQSAISISCGGAHTCAVLQDNTLKCWGRNNEGQLGYDDNSNRGNSAGSMSTIVAVSLGQTVKSVATGGQFTCAILNDDSLKCWGRNHMGQLGYNDTTTRGTSVGSMASLGTVPLGATVSYISANNYHTCAILSTGAVKCWGDNGNGRLGYNDTTNRGDTAGSMTTLGNVSLGQNALAISLGNYHTCAVLIDGNLKCWGMNSFGQLGYEHYNDIGNTVGSMTGLGNVSLGNTVKSVVLGELHSCAVLSNNHVKCWGLNGSGQLGYDDTVSRGDSVGSISSLTEIVL